VAAYCGGIAAGRGPGGAQAGQSDLTGYEVDELIACIGRSAAEGRAVEVPYRFPGAGVAAGEGEGS
jgi:hypothetical protein